MTHDISHYPEAHYDSVSINPWTLKRPQFTQNRAMYHRFRATFCATFLHHGKSFAEFRGTVRTPQHPINPHDGSDAKTSAKL